MTQRYRTVVLDQAGHAFYETTSVKYPQGLTDEINGTGACKISIPIDEPGVAEFVPIQREIAVWRDGDAAPIWRGPIVRPSAKTDSPAVVEFQCQRPEWYFTKRHFGGPGFPKNYLANPSLETWAAGAPVSWVGVGLSSLTQEQSPGLVELGNSAALLAQATPSADAYLHQTQTVGAVGALPNNGEGLFVTLVGWYYIVSMTTIPFNARGLYIELDSGATQEGFATFSFNAQTPIGSWQRAEVSIEIPAAGTGFPGNWNVDVRCYCPNGSIIWDALQLVIPESLTSQLAGGGRDVSGLMGDIVNYAQGKAGANWTQDTNKSDLHIAVSTPASGVVRSDLVYLYSQHRNIADALNDFPGFFPDLDHAILDSSPTVRTFTTFGRNVTDGATTAGSNTFTSATAAFTAADLYQPLWNTEIVGGLITQILSATQVVFSGAAAVNTTTGRQTLIGGRRGTFKPNMALEFGRNVVAVSPWDRDSEQAANSVVLTGDSTGPGAEVGSAIDLTQLGGVTIEEVIAAPSPTPIQSLSQLAAAELLAAKRGADILTIRTSDDFIENFGRFSPGDMTWVDLSWGYLNIRGQVWKVMAAVLDVEKEAYTLTMNYVYG